MKQLTILAFLGCLRLGLLTCIAGSSRECWKGCPQCSEGLCGQLTFRALETCFWPFAPTLDRLVINTPISPNVWTSSVRTVRIRRMTGLLDYTILSKMTSIFIWSWSALAPFRTDSVWITMRSRLWCPVISILFSWVLFVVIARSCSQLGQYRSNWMGWTAQEASCVGSYLPGGDLMTHLMRKD